MRNIFWTIILFTCYTTVKQEKKETTRTDKKKNSAPGL